MQGPGYFQNVKLFCLFLVATWLKYLLVWGEQDRGNYHISSCTLTREVWARPQILLFPKLKLCLCSFQEISWPKLPYCGRKEAERWFSKLSNHFLPSSSLPHLPWSLTLSTDSQNRASARVIHFSLSPDWFEILLSHWKKGFERQLIQQPSWSPISLRALLDLTSPT